MNNRYCISKTVLKDLWKKKNRDRLNVQVLKFEHLFSMVEMTDQMEKSSGAFHDAMTKDTAKFSAITANVEILLADNLSEFYFPGIETEICFEMRCDFLPTSDISYDDITANIESNTYIDFTIKSGEKQFDFQLKRCPQNRLSFTTEIMSEYIKKVVTKDYGDMSKTILIVLLQPEKEPKDHFDFEEIHKNILSIKNQITFDEINFIFNDENQQLIWLQMFPSFGLVKKPLVFTSEKYQKIQVESKKKL